MHRQWVRLSLVIIMLVVTGTAAYRIHQLDGHREHTTERGIVYDDLISGLAVSLSELQAAQQAYVADGQPLETWIGRTEAGLAKIVAALDDLDAQSMTPGAVDAIGQARTALETWQRLDAVARTHSENRQTLLASDVVFTEARQSLRQAASHLALAQSLEREARTAEHRTLRTGQLVALSAGLGVAFLVTVALSSRPSDDQGPVGTTDLTSIPASGSTQLDEERGDLDAEDPGDRDRRRRGPASVGEQVLSEPLSTLAAQPRTFIPNLVKAAKVCTDLSRLTEASALEKILEQACDTLNASGLIVWVRDQTGRTLRAVAGHGYSPDQLAKLGQVTSDGDNVTAAAFRTATVQALAGGGGPGAIAVPLLAAPLGDNRPPPTGAHACLGVLSVELRNGEETNEAVQATTSIFAAQLATLVAADPPDGRRAKAQAHAG